MSKQGKNMQTQTLEELKQEVEAEEAQSAKTEEAEVLEDNQEIESEQSEPEEAEAEPETAEQETEEWLSTGDSDPAKGEAQFSDSDVARVRRKLKGKLKEEKDENEKLRQKIEALESQVNTVAAPQKPAVQSMPTLEQFDFDESKYQQALAEWNYNQFEAKHTAKEREAKLRAQAEQQRAKIESSLDAYADNVMTLSKESGVPLDKFEASNQVVRQTIESALPGQGEDTFNQMVHAMGKGAEKVIHSLGINEVKRAQFSQLLREDPLKATLWLGEEKARLNSGTVKKKISKAPKPSPGLNNASSGGVSENSLRDAYRKEKNAQKQHELFKKGKELGFNPLTW